MKKVMLSCLMFAAFMLVSTGSPFQFLHIDSAKTAFALESGRDPAPDGGRGIRDDHRNRCRVPEPTTLALLAAGAVGVGSFGFIRRRNRK
jgi:hypothetical protein